MAKPGTVPNWASDTNFSTSPSAGENGTPTKAAPSAGYMAEGFVPGKNFVGQYVNYLLNLIVSWIAYLNLSGTDELTYASARNFVKKYQPGKGTRDSSGYADANLHFCSLDGAVTIIHVSTTTAGKWIERLDLPEGITITGVRAVFTPNGSGVCDVKLYKRSFDGTTRLPTATTQIGATGTTTTAGTQEVNIGVVSEAVSANNRYFLEFTSNSGGGATHTAHVESFELLWTASRATGTY